jgi:hypothetical protein
MLSNILRVSLTTPKPLLQRESFSVQIVLALFGKEEVGEIFAKTKKFYKEL